MTAIKIEKINKSENNNEVKNILEEKVGEIVSLHINQIQISEFMTRGNFVDEEHVQSLMNVIKEEGFLPGSSVWVNAIRGTNGEVLHYRLIAGRHRYEACRKLGMEKIPALVFYDLTDEEECLADHVSNEKDRRHKKVGDMEEVRHVIYLKETKGWSIRQIARAKRISKSEVGRKLQIAKLPKSVKDIFVTVPNGDTFPESYFREVCKLKSEPHQVMTCQKILGELNNENENTRTEAASKPANAKQVKRMVKELLILEAQGKIAEEAMQYIKDERVGDIESIVTVTEVEDIVETAEESWNELLKNVNGEYIVNRSKGLKYSTCPLWIKHCMGGSKLPSSSFMLLTEIISNDLRFKPKRNAFFFIKNGDCYKSTEDYLAAVINVKKKTLTKKTLPSIECYVRYKKDGSVMKFRVDWNKLAELYVKNAFNIPFHDGGLSGIPEDFSGTVSLTPYHSISIQNGKVVFREYKKNKDEVIEKQEKAENSSGKDADLFLEPSLDKPEVKEQAMIELSTDTDMAKGCQVENVRPEGNPVEEADADETEGNMVADFAAAGLSGLMAKQLKGMGMKNKQIIFCAHPGNVDTTVNVMKYLKEMPPDERDKIRNIPGYIFKMVRDGFSPPEGFVTFKEEQERKEKAEARRNVSYTIQREYDKGKKVFFCPKEGACFRITHVSSAVFGFRNSRGGISMVSFSEWPDLRFFRVIEDDSVEFEE